MGENVKGDGPEEWEASRGYNLTKGVNSNLAKGVKNKPNHMTPYNNEIATQTWSTRSEASSLQWNTTRNSFHIPSDSENTPHTVSWNNAELGTESWNTTPSQTESWNNPNTEYGNAWGQHEKMGDNGTTTPFPGYVNIQNVSLNGPVWDPWLANDTSACLWANDTLCYGNFTNASLASIAPDVPTEVDLRYWALLLLIFPVFTAFGNILVCLSVYKEKSLQSVTNYFIVSLAVADIMVALLVMPLAVYVEVSLNWSIISCMGS